MRTLIATLTGIGLTALMLTPPAHATDPPDTLVSVGTVTVETYDANHKRLLSVQTYGPETAGPDSTVTGEGSDSGNGGTSTASGCRKVTVHNWAGTLLGFTAYRTHTWLDWCWTRSTQTVTVNGKSWYLSDIDPQFNWKGVVSEPDWSYYYDFGPDDGHPRSGYFYNWMGHFESCVIKIAICQQTYPANVIRGHYDGTWSWETHD